MVSRAVVRTGVSGAFGSSHCPPRASRKPACSAGRNIAYPVAASSTGKRGESSKEPGPTWASPDKAGNLPAYSNGRPVTVLPRGNDNMFSSSGDAYQPQEHHKDTDALWEAIRSEARSDSDLEASLASALHSTILVHHSLAKTMAFVLANKLQSHTLPATHLLHLFQEAFNDDPDIMAAVVADMNAVFDRDPACEKYSHCMLNFKGFQAIQSYRISHWLFRKNRRALASALQSRIAELFHVDLHPGAKLGRGIMIDHATGVVIGETATVGDNVSILHHVTLGGSGTGNGVRHPNIGNGVLLGAGVVCLGPITVGHGSKIGAGSLVVSNLPDYCVAVGVPAKVLRRKEGQDPNKTMDQIEYVFDYII